MGFLDYFADFFRGTSVSRNLTITDVTRMAGDAVCIAAADGTKAVRLSTPQPRDLWLESIGSLAPADQISVTWRREKRYKPPHIEDGRWVPSSLTKVGSLAREEFLGSLRAQSFPSVGKAFGQPAFYSQRGNPAFTPGRGSRSLATLRVKRILLRPIGEGIRADFVDDDGVSKMVPVEDLAIRMHQNRCPECAGDGLAENLTAEFSGDNALVRIGLGRAFKSADNNRRGCYLQVNHVFPTSSERPSHFALTQVASTVLNR